MRWQWTFNAVPTRKFNWVENEILNNSIFTSILSPKRVHTVIRWPYWLQSGCQFNQNKFSKMIVLFIVSVFDGRLSQSYSQMARLRISNSISTWKFPNIFSLFERSGLLLFHFMMPLVFLEEVATWIQQMLVFHNKIPSFFIWKQRSSRTAGRKHIAYWWIKNIMF